MVNVLANEIAAALERQGRTQAWLAEAVGVSNAAVAKWMDNGEISRENAIKVAKVLGISLDRLLTGEASVGEQLAEAIEHLPRDNGQQVLDFILYRVDRSEEFLVNEPEKRDAYIRLIQKFRSDLARRKQEDGEPPK